MKVGEDVVPRIGLGSTFGGKTYSDNQKTKLEILEYGFSHGLKLVDTGEYYEGGVAEETVGKFLKGKRDRVFVSDKFKAANNYYQKVIQSCESSLKRLQTDYIDLYQIQWPNPEVPIEETFKALHKLKQDGKIRYIGVCNFTFNEFKQVDAVSLQTEFNLQNRIALNEILPFCNDNDRTLIGYNIFNQGFLNKADFINPIAYRYGKSIYQIILKWAVSKGILVLTNTMSLSHLKEIIEALYNLELTQSEIDYIDQYYNEPQLIEPIKIKVVSETVDHAHKVYTTLQEVKENTSKIHPSPYVLAEEIKRNGLLKPIEVKQTQGGYQLIHGSARFWAWQLAYQNKPIPCFVI